MGSGCLREDAALSSKRRRTWSRRLGIALACVLALGTLLYANRVRLLTGAARFLDVGDVPGPVDYVLVLGGGSESRPFVAAALLRTGLARKALVPTIRAAPETETGVHPTEHDLIQKVLRCRGVSADRIQLLPGECDSTIDEARSLARFLEGAPGATVAVVTHTYHTRRTRLVFRRQLGECGAQVRFLAAPTDDFDETNWWLSETGFQTYLTEYTKLAYTLARY